jgi:hypothetical protein
MISEWQTPPDFLGDAISITRNPCSESWSDIIVRITPWACLLSNPTTTVISGRITQDQYFPELCWITFTKAANHSPWLLHSSDQIPESVQCVGAKFSESPNIKNITSEVLPLSTWFIFSDNIQRRLYEALSNSSSIDHDWLDVGRLFPFQFAAPKTAFTCGYIDPVFLLRTTIAKYIADFEIAPQSRIKSARN